jgi:hypothetical protein
VAYEARLSSLRKKQGKRRGPYARVPVGGCAVVLRVVAAEKARGDAVVVLR